MPHKILENIDTGFEATIDQTVCVCHKWEKKHVAQLLGMSTIYILQEKTGFSDRRRAVANGAAIQIGTLIKLTLYGRSADCFIFKSPVRTAL
jgi:hypothetical protein